MDFPREADSEPKISAQGVYERALRIKFYIALAFPDKKNK
jgi:hypothetical protein